MFTEKDKILLDYLLKEYYKSESFYLIQEKRILLRSRSISNELIKKISKVIDYNFDIKSQIPKSPLYKRGFYTVIMFLI